MTQARELEEQSLQKTTMIGFFSKSSPGQPAWIKTGPEAAAAACTLYIEINGTIKTVAAKSVINMPVLVAGTDYTIWFKPDGTLEATGDHILPPASNSRKVGGFHYAPGGHSGAPGGGNTTPGIWAGSFWDIKWRPVCANPHGMEYWCGTWMDMYLTGVDAITVGSSKYNVTIADGSSPPKVPVIFGGNGSIKYSSYTWFEAAELAMALGKRLPVPREFAAHAYGTMQASSIGSDQDNTGLAAAYTSAAGLFQATGVMWIWGDEQISACNTESQVSKYIARAVLFGGDWLTGTNAGNRCSYWSFAASDSCNDVGSRFCCDHLQLD